MINKQILDKLACLNGRENKCSDDIIFQRINLVSMIDFSMLTYAQNMHLCFYLEELQKDIAYNCKITYMDITGSKILHAAVLNFYQSNSSDNKLTSIMLDSIIKCETMEKKKNLLNYMFSIYNLYSSYNLSDKRLINCLIDVKCFSLTKNLK